MNRSMKTIELTLEDRIELAKRWFLNSGIQSEDGGFYAWQDMENKSHSYLYSEITGYAITILCFLYKVTKENIFLEKAWNAAQWILHDALDKKGAVLTRNYVKDPVEHYSFERGNVYSFDCAMVAFGMLKLYGLTGNEKYLTCAESIINFLNNKMLKPSGIYYPIFDLKDNKSMEDPVKWSTQSGSFHSKLALCLCELAALKRDNSYNNIARKLVESSVNLFFKDNRFITNVSDDSSHFHPYSYTLEGMIYYSDKTRDGSYKGIIERAFGKIVSLQDADGGFPTRVSGSSDRDVPYQRSDIQAQILRLSYFVRSGLDRDKLIEKVSSFQNINDDYKGGFLFGVDHDGTVKRHSNAWCSMFALQALYLASGKIVKEIVLDYLV